MHSANESEAANGSVNSTSGKTVSTEQMQTVLKFLPIFENMKPDDFARPPETTEDYIVGHVQYHRAVYEFERACYESGFVQSFD